MTVADLGDAAKTAKTIWDLTSRAYRSFKRPATEAAKARDEAIKAVRAGKGVLEEGQTAAGAINKIRQGSRAAIRLERKALKELNPNWFNSLSGRQKVALIGGGAIGGAGAIKAKNTLFGGSSNYPGMQNPELLPYQTSYATGANLPTSATVIPGSAGTVPASTGNYIDDAIAAVQQSYANQKFYAPGGEMYDPLTALTKQLSQATTAEMNNLAQQYATGAAGIKDSGVSGGTAINDIYKSGAATMSDIAATPMGEYDSMIPVSGAAATAPQEYLAQGQNLANYLQKNQLISAQEAGGMAALAQMLGPAYQNQYNIMDTQFRAAAEANKARVLADAQNTATQNLQNNLLDLRLEGLQTAEQDKKIRNYAESVLQWGTPEATAAWKEWVETIAKDPAIANAWAKAGVTSPQQYVNAKRNQALQKIIDEYGVQ